MSDDPKDILINDLIRTKQPAPQPDLDSSAMAKALEEQLEKQKYANDLYYMTLGKQALEIDRLRAKLLAEQTKWQEMEKYQSMLEEVFQIWRRGGGHGTRLHEVMQRYANTRHADKIMKGEGNG